MKTVLGMGRIAVVVFAAAVVPLAGVSHDAQARGEGAYLAVAMTNERAYFFEYQNIGGIQTRVQTPKYLVKGDVAKAASVDGYWYFIEFVNQQGVYTSGWMLKHDFSRGLVVFPGDRVAMVKVSKARYRDGREHVQGGYLVYGDVVKVTEQWREMYWAWYQNKDEVQTEGYLYKNQLSAVFQPVPLAQ